jgi:putative ABC transport system permease protein
MDQLLQDLRFAARTLRKSPAFTAIAVVCLSLGIATNTTLFSILNAILLRPQPFTDPSRVVFLREHYPKGRGSAEISYLNYLDWKAQTRTLSDMGAASGRSLSITEGEEPERLVGDAVTANLFPMLGVRPQIGRLFRPDEDKPGAPGVILLSDEVWHRRYAGDSGVVGRVISVNDNPYTVVGVMPPRFKFPEDADLWIALAPVASAEDREWRTTEAFGRLAPGMTVAEADRDVAAVSQRVKRQYGLREDNLVGSVTSLSDRFIDPEVRTIVTTMYGAVVFVLLIACANVANLLLTRASAREREIAVRAAIGAGRGRIVRQFLTESVLVAVAAGVVALPLTWTGLRLVELGIPAEDPIPYYMHWSLDTPTLLYTAGVSVLAGLLFGLAPALQAARGDLHEALKEGGRGTGAGVRKNRLRSGLVVVEIALALVLLIGASLFVRSFALMQRTQLGFDPSRIMTMRLYLVGHKYDSATVRRQRMEDVVRRVQALPGVEAATVSTLIPLGGGLSGDGYVIDGRELGPNERAPALSWATVSNGWFETLGVHLLAGRAFSDAEQNDSVAVAVVSNSMVRAMWPNENPIGRRFRLASDSSRTWYSVIGVAPDIRVTPLDDKGTVPATAYFPLRRQVGRGSGLMVRVRSGNPVAITRSVRDQIRAVDPTIPVSRLLTEDKVRSLSVWEYGLFGMMFSTFGGIALVLAAVGVYGVISYGVSQRTQEIGVRVALGAQRRHVVNMVVRQGMTLAAAGIVFGIVGAFGVTRVVKSLLIGVSPTDPMSFAGVAVFLAMVAALASYFPARRATRVDPIVALRFE